MPITQHFNDPGLRVGTVGSLIVTCYRVTPTVVALDEIDRVEVKLLEQFPKVATIAIAGEKSNLLRIDEQVRARSVELTRKYQGKVRGAAIVIATRGLSAVMARSFMTAYLLVSKQSWPMQTFSTIEAAATWLQALPGHDAPFTAAELEAFDRGD
ncbi:MAG: hypothetical protein U0228_00055 [Myxococcaceae bacterium]